MEEIKTQIRESLEIKKLLLQDDQILEAIQKSAGVCIEALKNGKKLLLAGNGGSAADAQHIAGELVNRFGFDRPAIAAVAISTDTSVLTSIANDYDYKLIFSRQIEALGNTGDVLISLSTSGNSENIIEGIRAAKQKGIITIGMTGSAGGKMSDMCDLVIHAPSSSTPRIQEIHILVAHIICTIIEKDLFS